MVQFFSTKWRSRCFTLPDVDHPEPSNEREIRSHKDLLVWQAALDLVESIYEITTSFPREERFGLTSQLRRSAVSVASNISEGSARKSRAEFLQFVYVARGSLAELETQLEIAARLGFLTRPIDLEAALTSLGRMLSALVKSLRPA